MTSTTQDGGIPIAGGLEDVNLLLELDGLDVCALLTRGIAPAAFEDFVLVDGAIPEIVQTTMFEWLNSQLGEARLTFADVVAVDVEGYTDERTAQVLEEHLTLILSPVSVKTFMLDTEAYPQ
jgi:hypothetical protein